MTQWSFKMYCIVSMYLFSSWWFLVLFHCALIKIQKIISVFLYLLGFSLCLKCGLFWSKFHGVFRRMCSLWLLGWMFYRCLLLYFHFEVSFISDVSLLTFCHSSSGEKWSLPLILCWEIVSMLFFFSYKLMFLFASEVHFL
jgi:hypothetical protein